MLGKKKSLTIAIFFLRVVISAPAPGTGLEMELELDANDEEAEATSESMAREAGNEISSIRCAWRLKSCVEYLEIGKMKQFRYQ